MNKQITKIKERGMSVKEVSDCLGINKSTLYRKIKNNYFLCGELFKIKDILNLDYEEIKEIFIK